MQAKETFTSQNNKRIYYIDLLKGFAILWIVWYHQPHPQLIDHYFHVPIFFFLSGLFFNQKAPRQFFKSLIFKIIIPFLFFYAVSYCFQIARYLFENYTLNEFKWNCILDIFRIESYIDHITINRPLWFLVSLAIIQTFYYGISRLPKTMIIAVSICIILLKGPICSWKTPLMINQSIFWLAYFALGDVLGKWIVSQKSTNTHWRLIAIAILVCFFGTLSLVLPCIKKSFLYNTVYETTVICFVVLSLIVFSFFRNSNYITRILIYYGRNSLIVLGLHLLVSILYGGIFFRIFHITGDYHIGFANFILTTATLYPIIMLLNKHLPVFVGKKNIYVSK